MKRSILFFVTLMLTMATGFQGLNAQNFRGNQYLRNNRGACVNTPNLTAEQQKAIQELSTNHIQEMNTLRTQFRTTADASEAAAIRLQMDQIQADHRNQIMQLGGITPNIPRSAYQGGTRGLGRGAGFVQGRGVGAGFGRGAARLNQGGRGLGPCGAGLGRINR